MDAGRSVLFTPTYQFVQQQLVARRDLRLSRALRALDTFDAIILDDLGPWEPGGRIRCEQTVGTMRAILDTDILSEVLKAKDPNVKSKASAYRAEEGRYTFSTIRVMEIIKGLSRKRRDDATTLRENALDAEARS